MKNLAFIILALTLTGCNCTKKASGKLIQECPDEKIINNMPTVGDNNTSKEYYIYKGERREIKEFDANWIAKNCNVKTSIVH